MTDTLTLCHKVFYFLFASKFFLLLTLLKFASICFNLVPVDSSQFCQLVRTFVQRCFHTKTNIFHVINYHPAVRISLVCTIMFSFNQSCSHVPVFNLIEALMDNNDLCTRTPHNFWTLYSKTPLRQAQVAWIFAWQRPFYLNLLRLSAFIWIQIVSENEFSTALPESLAVQLTGICKHSIRVNFHGL